MELSTLRIFVSAAKHESFSSAARELFLSHSTVSRAVSSLEEELGVCLFTRGNKSSCLTAEGQALLKEAEELLFRVDSLKSTLKAMSEGTDKI